MNKPSDNLDHLKDINKIVLNSVKTTVNLCVLPPCNSVCRTVQFRDEKEITRYNNFEIK